MNSKIFASRILSPFRDRWFLGIFLLVVLLGVFYNSILLLAHDVDEARHMNYIKLLLEEGRLPYVISNQPYQEYAGAHAFHPPLYYLVLLPFYAVLRSLPYELSWHLMRVLSLIICLAALPLIYQIAQRAGRLMTEKANGEESLASKIFARLVVAQIALMPMFGMTANMINNDSACFLAVTILLWLLIVKYPHDRTLKSAAVLGLVWGFASLTKSTALLCGGVALVAYLLAQEGKATLTSSRQWMRLGVALLCLAFIAGWWHMRSYMLYGSFMPVPPSMPSPALPSPSQGTLVMMMHDNFPFHFAFANWGLFSTLWSQKEWFPESIRSVVYLVLALYALLAIVGVIVSKAYSRISRDAVVATESGDGEFLLPQRVALWSTYCMFLANWLTVLQVALFWHWGWADGGRYLLPSVCGLSIFLAYGWRSLVKTSGLRYVTLAWIILMTGLNAVAIYWLITFLNPTYGPRG